MGILCRNITINMNGTNGNTSSNSGNSVLQAAMKYNDQFLPKGATGDNGTPLCSHLLFYALQDLGIWKEWKDANSNCDRLSQDSRFIEIKYTSGEKAEPGDIMCVKRSGKSGHNMICTEVDGNGIVTKVIQAGSSSDPKGKNHVRIASNWCTKGKGDYNNLHVFRLKA